MIQKLVKRRRTTSSWASSNISRDQLASLIFLSISLYYKNRLISCKGRLMKKEKEKNHFRGDVDGARARVLDVVLEDALPQL
jgi:hypothetical protein